MELRIVVLVGIAAVTGWVARGTATGSRVAPVAAAATPAPPPRIVYVSSSLREAPPPDDEAAEPDAGELDAGEDLGELLARVQRAAPPPRPPDPPHNLITGIVTTPDATERLPGVTVVVTGSQIDGSRTAISDESGEFSVPDLPAGSYTVMFYYNDATVEQTNVIVSSLRHTAVNTQIEPESYIKNIPVPGRTFESVLGEGISFSGTVAMDNTYVVDGIDVTTIE